MTTSTIKTIKQTPNYRLKACVRCRGDAYLDADDGSEWRCLQCGRRVDLEADQMQTAVPVGLPAAA